MRLSLEGFCRLLAVRIISYALLPHGAILVYITFESLDDIPQRLETQIIFYNLLSEISRVAVY